MSEEQVNTDDEHDKIVVLRETLLYLHVCAPATWDSALIAAWCTTHRPPGTSYSWWTVLDADSEEIQASGLPNPCVCADDESRLHWALSC